MKNDRQMLDSILETTQTGQISIQTLLDISIRPELRKTLLSQLREYRAIESETHTLASQRGWELREMQPGTRMITSIKARMKAGHRNSDSSIAAMMIHENTNGMILNLRILHQYQQQDSQISALSQRLVDCQTANIRRMQGLL